jgi:hypothetical protein
MLRGDVRGAVRVLTKRDKEGVLIPGNMDEKTGDPVATVLQSKHPNARMPDASMLPVYEDTPEFVDLDITKDIVKSVAITSLAAPFWNS